MFTKGCLLLTAPCVEWYLPADSAEWPQFCHLGSAVDGPDPAAGLAAGHSCWVALVAGHAVGLAWDWVEVAHGVPALRDPNSLVSNLQFLSAEGEPMGELGATVCLSRLVHRLAWQAPVRMLLQARRPRRGPRADAIESQPCLTVVKRPAATQSQTRTRVQPE